MSNPVYPTHYFKDDKLELAYHYENSKSKQLIVLCHGYPDTSYTWRHLMPILLKQGYAVLCADQAGYGKTNSPDGIEYYSLKFAASNLVRLLDHLGIGSAIWIGHDFGSPIVQNVYLYYPQYVRGLVALSVPFQAPKRLPFRTLEQVCEQLPNLSYQLFLAQSTSYKVIESIGIDVYLMQLYQAGKSTFDLSREASLDTRLISPQEFKLYCDLFTKTSFKGPNQWYSAHEINYMNEVEWMRGKPPPQIRVPALFIGGELDAALPPSMWTRQERLFSASRLLTAKSLVAGHWLLWEQPRQVESILLDWLSSLALNNKL